MSGKSSRAQPLQWVIDNGASHHMTPNITVLDKIHDLLNPICISQPERKIVVVKEAGTIYLGGGLTLKEVLYTPTFKCNLTSVQKLAKDENCIVVYGADFCVLHDLTSRKPIGMAEMRNTAYFLKISAGGTSYVTISTKELSIWHQGLSHPSLVVYPFFQKIVAFD